MAFNIQQFQSEAAGYGFMRPAHFLVAIPSAPPWYRGNTRFLSYLCSSANLPGTQVLTSEERQMGYGPSRKVPYDVAHGDITLTFYADGDGQALAFFDEWLRNTIAFGNPSVADPISGAQWGEVQYPANYETPMQIYLYNENPGQGSNEAIEIIKYSIDCAYPVSISDVQLDWSNGDTIQMVQVTFAYKTFWIEKNMALKYGNVGPAVVRDPGYLARARGGGLFDRENEFARYAADNAQSTTPGFIGIPFVDQMVAMVSNVYSSISDKVTLVNGYASKINSQINSIGALASLGRKNPVSVPQVPTIRFPR